MKAGSSSTRDQIVRAADDLFYRQGYAHTSFADIAAAVEISRGNFYFHFRTKDEILEAVIAARLERTRLTLQAWSEDGGDPSRRIDRFIQMMVGNRLKIRNHGCPVGTLCGELGKLEHPAQKRARQLFALYRDWLCEQFAAMGTQQPEPLAMQLLARSQGAATLAHAFQDEAFLLQEVARMRAWLADVVRSAPKPSAGGRANSSRRTRPARSPGRTS